MNLAQAITDTADSTPNDNYSSLACEVASKIQNREAVIGIIGLGYVGLPLMTTFCQKDFNVIGFDIDQRKIDALAKGESYIKHIDSQKIQEYQGDNLFKATADFSKISDVDVIILCVPTPLSKNRVPDLKYIEDTAEAIYPHIRKGQLVVLESTVYPGTTEEILKPALEKSGLKAGEDFFVAFSPEREDPGNEHYTTATIPKVVGADTADALFLSKTLYGEVISQVVPVSTASTAEAVKLMENIFRSVNIALVNEMKVIYDLMGIDIWEVIDAAKTKPFGYMPFYPGPGLGGHCIPIDPFYLTWKAREADIPTRFIELAGEVNAAMPAHIVNCVANALNDKQGKAIKGSRILLVGMAYKKNVDDMRESPSRRIMELLIEKGAEIEYHDPYVPEIGKIRIQEELRGMHSVDLTPETLSRYDAALICTDHDNIDWDALVSSVPLTIDTRNATKNVTDNRDRIVKA